MKTDLRKLTTVNPFAATVEQTEALLGEHHVVAWSRSLHTREDYGIELVRHLRGIAGAETVVINGAVVHDLDGFCRQLERSMPVLVEGSPTRVARTLDGPGGIVERLRDRSGDPSRPTVRQRYYVWRDADTLLRSDEGLFARLVDALAGVAAESEYASEDLLLLHRTVFIGGAALAGYAEQPTGPFNAWLSETPTDASTPRRPHPSFWSVVTGLPRPPFARLYVA